MSLNADLETEVAAIIQSAWSENGGPLAFFTTGVDPQPLPVRIYSSIRFGVSPAINAVGTLMLAVSALLIVAALLLPRLFNRKSSSLDLITGGERR